LAELSGKNMTDDEFAAKFESQNPEWKKRYGLTDVSEAVQIAKKLGLAKSTLTANDSDEFQEIVKDKGFCKSLVFTQKAKCPKTGNLIELNHCRLATEISGTDVTLYNPTQDGGAHTETVSLSTLEEQDAAFVAFVP
jgi:hypothetical protein